MAKDKLKTAAPIGNTRKETAEIQAARKVFAALATAIKNYSLYPPDHTYSKKNLVQLHSCLEGLFAHQRILRLEVNRAGLFYKETCMYSAAKDEDPVVTPLFRDGILWVEVLSGVSVEELARLLELLNSNRVLSDDPEGDLVTALWKANIPHIRYEAIDTFWEDHPAIDFKAFLLGNKAPAEQKDDKAEQKDDKRPDAHVASPAVNEMLPGLDPQKLELTATETQQLAQLISEEYSRDRNEDIIDILIVIAENQKTENAFGEILELIKHEFIRTLLDGEFNLTHQLLKLLKGIRHCPPGTCRWREERVDAFLSCLSKPETLKALESAISKLNTADTNQILKFQQAMLELGPEAVYSLGPLLLKTPSQTLNRHFMGIIGKLSLRDLTPLEQLVNQANDAPVKQLIFILGHIKGKKSVEALLRMIGHRSETVRQEALRWLLKRRELPIEKLATLMEDTSIGVRTQILNHLGQRRDKRFEGLLRNFIMQSGITPQDSRDLTPCFLTLGKCASNDSLPFLQKTLFERPWLDLLKFKTSPNRQGAAIALSELKTEQAQQILSQAARSFFPNIRKACRTVPVMEATLK